MAFNFFPAKEFGKKARCVSSVLQQFLSEDFSQLNYLGRLHFLPLLMYSSRKPRYGGGSGTPRDSPGTHRELVPRAGREVSESRGRADPGHPPGGRESRGTCVASTCNAEPWLALEMDGSKSMVFVDHALVLANQRCSLLQLHGWLPSEKKAFRNLSSRHFAPASCPAMLPRVQWLHGEAPSPCNHPGCCCTGERPQAQAGDRVEAHPTAG